MFPGMSDEQNAVQVLRDRADRVLQLVAGGRIAP
jgi:hypothetical protein